MARLSVIQLHSLPDVTHNLQRIRYWLTQLSPAAQHIVLLPECCLYFGGKECEQLTLAKASQNLLLNYLAELAGEFNITLVAGSIPILTEKGDKFYNTSFVFSPQGEQLASYQKIHLFDVQVEDNEKNYCESKYTQAGKNIVVANTPMAKIGLTICYDLRFPELYRALSQQGADIITVPSAFTKVTGKAHWLPLLQARAIENQVYIMAAGQEGKHQNGRETWGHSVIISPWGEVLACQAQGEGIASAIFDTNKIATARASIPVQSHNKFNIDFKGE